MTNRIRFHSFRASGERFCGVHEGDKYQTAEMLQCCISQGAIQPPATGRK